jgi:hypothetical protein
MRIGGIAVVDTLLTILLAAVFAYAFKISFWLSLLGWFVAGEILHYVFGTQTAFLTMIGIKAC